LPAREPRSAFRLNAIDRRPLNRLSSRHRIDIHFERTEVASFDELNRCAAIQRSISDRLFESMARMNISRGKNFLAGEEPDGRGFGTIDARGTHASFALANWIRSRGYNARAWPGPSASALLLIPPAIAADWVNSANTVL